MQTILFKMHVNKNSEDPEKEIKYISWVLRNMRMLKIAGSFT